MNNDQNAIVETEDEVSLNDDIRAAFEEASAASSTEATKRDEAGRFTAAGEEPKPTEPTQKTTETPAPTEQELKVPGTEEAPGNWNKDQAPQSWTPAARERWGEIPEDLRKEIVRREEAAVHGFRKMQEQFEPIRRVAEGLSPFLQEAAQYGAEPVGYIANVMNTERVLRTAPVRDKFQALINIADQYGVPLRQIINDSVGEKVFETQPQQNSVHPEIQRQLEEINQWREQQTQQVHIQQIREFAQTKEFFNDVKEEMALLLDSGRAKDLADAYEQATWLNPQVRDVLIKRQQGQVQEQKTNERRQAAASASLPTPGAVNVSTKDDADDIYSAVRSSIAELSRG